MDQKYLVSVANGAGSLSNTEIGKKTLDMRISSEYSYNPGPDVLVVDFSKLKLQVVKL